jgi:hypothetical protein
MSDFKLQAASLPPLRVPKPNGARGTVTPTACALAPSLKCGGTSAEMHRRLTYSEWQSALPRMPSVVRRWNDDCGHQLECDDDAASITSTAAAVSEAAPGTVRVVLKRVRPLPPDRARSASEVLSGRGASPCRRTWLWSCIGGQCGHRDRHYCWQSAGHHRDTPPNFGSLGQWAPHARCDQGC